MIGYVMVGTNSLDKAIIFYDEVLKVINLTRKETDEVCAGYTQNNGDGSIEFYVTKPANKKTATFGNGTQVSFLVSSREIVDKFHEISLKAGGTSEGSGGERPEGSGVYYSYVRDLDGNKICAFTNNK
tara:strand:- start:783 stop:1166 length:384 start_codon:yes stop_codon:yes gene_type:complete